MVRRLRERFPRWGKDRLTPLLHRLGYRLTVSCVGRILKHLKRRGILREPPWTAWTRRRRAPHRPYAVRKPRSYQPQHPGDLVQLDTMDLRPLPGVVLKHFTARDVVSRWDVLAVGRSATATAAARFLDTLLARMPFLVRAIQVDGGSEFHAAFEQSCQQRGIRLFVLPPRSPKLNGCVERAHRTHQEEFYDLYDGDLDLPTLSAALSQWERVSTTPSAPIKPLPGARPWSIFVPATQGLPPPPLQSHMYWTSTTS